MNRPCCARRTPRNERSKRRITREAGLRSARGWCRVMREAGYTQRARRILKCVRVSRCAETPRCAKTRKCAKRTSNVASRHDKRRNPWLHNAATRGFLLMLASLEEDPQKRGASMPHSRVFLNKMRNAPFGRGTCGGVFDGLPCATRPNFPTRRIRRPFLHNAPFGQAVHVAAHSTTFPIQCSRYFPMRRAREGARVQLRRR